VLWVWVCLQFVQHTWGISEAFEAYQLVGG